ncbi:MAG: glycosyltransferase family 4 protein [candidate division Zixibacteria bacterium]|nr:glycosyltransferase family 4 protein [candidate division Zixibacteria bacterium]
MSDRSRAKNPDTKSSILYLCADRGIPVWGNQGASSHIREFTTALKNLGYDIAVATANYDPISSDPQSIPLHDLCLKTNEMGNRFFSRTNFNREKKGLLREAKMFFDNAAHQAMLYRIHRHSQCELVYERYSLFGIAGREFASLMGLPFILEVNSPLVDETIKHRKLELVDLARSVERYLFSTSDHIIAVSEVLKDYVLSVAPQAKVSVAPNAVNSQVFENFLSVSDSSETFIPELEGKFVIGFLGSLKPWHGIDILIRSFAKIVTHDSQYHLLVIGDGQKVRIELDELIKELKINSYITFTGEAPHKLVPEYLKKCDVLVAPYPQTEKFYFSPIKIFEYMISGRAIVASNIGQIGDLLDDEETAILLEPSNVASLSDALKRLKNDPSLRERIGKTAREEALKKHTWAERIKSVASVLRDEIEINNHDLKRRHASAI